MMTLLRLNFIHVLRSRLLYILILFSVLIQFGVLKAVKNMTVSLQGMVTVIGPRQGLFFALFLQMFTGAFLSAVYGLWLMPYLHTGSRAPLTFVLPISKWWHIASYSIVVIALLALQYVILLLSWGVNFGFGSLAGGDFGWNGLMVSFACETLFFVFLAFAFALGSMTVGHVTTFLFAGIGMAFLQVVAAFLRMNPPEFLAGAKETFETVQRWYVLFPPVGDIAFDLKAAITRGSFDTFRMLQWSVWVALVICAFRWRLRRISLRPTIEA